MKHEEARRIMDAARAEAQRMEKAVTIIIVDAAGAPMLLERLDGSTALHAMIAEGKAAGSAFTGRDSALNVPLATNNPALAASIAQRVSAAPMSGTVPILRPVAGSSTSSVPRLSASTQAPST